MTVVEGQKISIQKAGDGRLVRTAGNRAWVQLEEGGELEIPLDMRQCAECGGRFTPKWECSCDNGYHSVSEIVDVTTMEGDDDVVDASYEEPWSVRWKGGWCMMNAQPNEFTTKSVPPIIETRCGSFVLDGWAVKRQVPDCDDCRRVLHDDD